ncbi:MAG: type I DNA topoisomerase, partial [Oscillospiraceae bacterium]|nr:type I DNA topoisomerase [Oscillospiraceae bacterium]
LDRIVGYTLSHFLWKNIRGGSSLSAGRVQSVAVKLIVDREREIEAFVPEEYWSIDAKLCEKGESYAFSAKLQTKNGEKIEIKTGEEASSIVDELKGVPFVIGAIKKSIRKKQPAPPFITSTLQQEASLRLGFQPRRTMRIAQELYEGIDVPGMGAVGLITYMRTDSLRVSAEAKQAAAAYIEQTFGKEYLPSAAKAYKTKAGAQDAHEAIRPTMPEINPEKLKSSLTPEQYKLYKLVWDRFIASQMAAALYDTVSIDINAGDYGFKASGFSVRFDGFSVLYPYGDEEKSSIPKHANSGDVLKVREIKPNQHFTAPPSRFTEASLIKALEENGIGRPSTYAPIITTIISRNYVERDGKALKPTALGTVTVDLITEHFANIVDVDFTAKMEKDLDKVESGKTDWVHMMKKFYEDFQKSLELAQKNQGAEKIKVPEEETDVICEKCGRKMVVKTGRFGKFLACPGYPQCQNTKLIVKETLGECPLCGAKILSKKSKTGKTYYGCEHNPTCGFMSWDEPTAEKCPACGKSLLYKKGRSAKIYCSNPECDYERAVAAK